MMQAQAAREVMRLHVGSMKGPAGYSQHYFKGPSIIWVDFG